MLTLDMTEQVLMLDENAAELASSLKLLEAVLFCMHPKHVFLKGIGQEFALAQIALHLVLSSFSMLRVYVVRHRFWV